MIAIKMKTITKILMRFFLVCYLVVSSLATVHAFPSFDGLSDVTQGILLSSEDMQANCHQNIDDSSDSTKVTACELFCSAMGNVISNEIFIEADSVRPTQDIQFFTLALSTRQIALEPHPPK